MAVRTMLPGDPIATASLDLPQDVLTHKLAVEQVAIIEVMADDANNARVLQEHASIWLGPEPLASPAHLPEEDRKA